MQMTPVATRAPKETVSSNMLRSTGVPKFVRGWLTALFTTCLATLGHTLAMSVHTDAPVNISPMLFGVILALTGPVCVALAGKKLSSLRTLVSVIFGQLVFHLLYALAGPNTQGTVTGIYDSEVADFSAGGNAFAQACHLIGLTFTSDGASQLNPVAITMALAHLVAAVVTTALIVHGERVLFALLHRVIRPAIVVLGSMNFPVSTHRIIAWGEPVFLKSPTEVFTRCLTRRGPPNVAVLTA